MSVGQRIQQRLDLIGMSQAELARRVGMSQGAMNNLIGGRSRSSTRLHSIARELNTTPAFLAGETDDPKSDAPVAPEPAYLKTVMMHVALPSERALTAMFRGLVLGIDLSLPTDEIAQLLARRLPIGLSQLEDVLPDPLEEQNPDEMPLPASSHAKHHPEPQS
ncbi:helix-turn-helix transcriptional regulator [Sphingomonas sp. SORGH_AS_0802]|uniref:helix-turn-helix domain-containing protein n=1 Tax=Sphingomonas sp. SORGH_AS_0802 TaxID=3041800 RepID=UPI00286C2EA7|nr:helix-turn-helix transcriptional regulator [Sphingomonas sp. SORGH_AS_0802]